MDAPPNSTTYVVEFVRWTETAFSSTDSEKSMDGLIQSFLKRAEDVALDVLARGQDHRLLPRLQVGRTDLRIEVDIGLILVEDLVLGGGA